MARLMQPDMWSGWGVRTLSASHPLNPYSYQNGLVWPHDNGLILQGFRRYGYAAETGQIANDVCGAGYFFMLNQIPELYAGLQPDAPHKMLYVDPVLPPWLSDVTLRELRAGEQTFDIRSWRTEETTQFDLLRGARHQSRIAR